MTWASLASLARRRPISTAALPPTPASTSAKPNVGTGSAPAKTTSIASITRDSSPPEAPLCSGSAGAPGLEARRISTSSAPCGTGSASGVSTTEILACGMASAVSSAVTSSANRSADPGRGQPRPLKDVCDLVGLLGREKRVGTGGAGLVRGVARGEGDVLDRAIRGRAVLRGGRRSGGGQLHRGPVDLGVDAAGTVE